MKAEIHAWEKTLINPSLPTLSALKARVAALEAEVARLTAERDAAVRALAEEGRRRGQAEAKIDAMRRGLALWSVIP